MLDDWDFPWKCWDLRIRKYGNKKLELLFQLPSFWGFWDKMEQPQDGEKIPLGIGGPGPKASWKIPNFSSKRLFWRKKYSQPNIPGNFLPATKVHLGMGTLCFIPNPRRDSQIFWCRFWIKVIPKIFLKWRRGKNPDFLIWNPSLFLFLGMGRAWRTLRLPGMGSVKILEYFWVGSDF